MPDKCSVTKEIIFSLLFFGICFATKAQEIRLAPNPSESDYQRAQSFVWDSLSQKIFQNGLLPQWFGDNSGFAYQTKTREGNRYYKVLFSDLKRNESMDVSKFAKSLSNYTGESIDKKELPISILHWVNPQKFNFTYNSKTYQIDLHSYKIKTLEDSYKSTEKNISVSPDKEYEVFIKDYNLYLRNRKTHKERALTTKGNKDSVYGSSYGWSQVMRGEGAIAEPKLKLKWSPNSKKIFTQISDFSDAEKMYMLDWSIDSLYRPELVSYYRPSPGDTTFVKLRPIVIDIKTGEITSIPIDPQPHMLDLGKNLYWRKDSKRIYGTYDHRGFQQKDLLEFDSETGIIEIKYSDKSDTNIDYDSRFRFFDSEDLAFFTSEKSGWKQLYRLNWKTKEVKQLTNGNFVVNTIEGVDLDKKEIYFTASGREEGVNPYYDLLYKVDFSGKKLQLLTSEAYNHDISISPDKKYFIDNISAPDYPTKSVLRSTQSGEIISEIQKADIKDLEEIGWSFPETFSTKAKDGETEIYGALWKPTNFDPELTYPVVDYTYSGPHMFVFPNTFSKGVYGLYNSAQALAELGFVVIQIDGRGSSGRSKAFHDKSYRDLGNNLEDHAEAIRYLANKYDWVDGNRVGIFGHSFGGYDAAHALMAFNDTYKVAISESADHDWRMEKAWYPELYAGWPVEDQYHEQSNITMADQMKGKLLLIHGGLDENVNPSATFKLSEALIKADKYFDLLIVPSARHAFPKKYYPYIQKKRWDFFVEHLIRNKP